MNPPLDYQRKTIIYRGTRPIQSVLLHAVISYGLLTVMLLAGIYLMMVDDRNANTFGKILLGAEAIGVVFYIVQLARGRFLRNFEISVDGVHDKGELTSWKDITRFAAVGSPRSKRVILFFIAPWTVRILKVDQTISPAKYETILSDIRRELGDNFPNLKLGGYLANSREIRAPVQ